VEIEIDWSAPFKLGKYYKLEDPKRLPEKPGIYMFARIHSEKTKLIYIGKAINLKKRVLHQLKNRYLRRKMKRERQVSRVLFVGELQTWTAKEKVDKALRIVESALIAHALAEDHDIVNVQGKHRPTHNLKFTGNLKARKFTGPYMKVRKTNKS
jgi:hypothetical protein